MSHAETITKVKMKTRTGTKQSHSVLSSFGTPKIGWMMPKMTRICSLYGNCFFEPYIIIIGSTYAESIWVIALFDWFVSPFQVGDMHIVWQSISSMSRSNPALGGENTIFLKLYGEW